ncbi:hypothetical protein AX17_006651 [Amanita inopinata Kibby_2008]|nr:hypothetical protein AX17_006651 [Amanita inopinata Kibby_2008]
MGIVQVLQRIYGVYATTFYCVTEKAWTQHLWPTYRPPLNLPSNMFQHSYQEPPAWTPAPEQTHTFGRFEDVSEIDYRAAEEFCHNYPPNAPSLLSSTAIERINALGCNAWGMQCPDTQRFNGTITHTDSAKLINISNSNESPPPVSIRIKSEPECREVCLLSDLPILAGLYDIRGKDGIYYEVKINNMNGIIAVGTACKPYPGFRFPGWNRLSAGFHLDDFRKFFEDPCGGRDYAIPLVEHINPGDTVGCGYEFRTGALFFTYNGVRLDNAFTGIYLPRQGYDVYAAVGLRGECDLEVNFGGGRFRWREGNEWQWKVEGHVGQFTRGLGQPDDVPPAYDLYSN